MSIVETPEKTRESTRSPVTTAWIRLLALQGILVLGCFAFTVTSPGRGAPAPASSVLLDSLAFVLTSPLSILSIVHEWAGPVASGLFWIYLAVTASRAGRRREWIRFHWLCALAAVTCLLRLGFLASLAGFFL